MNKPLIVLTPQAQPMEEPFRQNYHYTNAFNTTAVLRAGGLPLVPAFLSTEDARELMGRADGLLLTGGEDLDPTLFGEEKLPACGAVCPERDRCDFVLLEAALALHKPVLCICRGCQAANVYFGGSLYQDIPTQFLTGLRHSDYPGYADESAHEVALLPDTPIWKLLGEDRIPVNSLHHQAIRSLAPMLRPMAFADDGLVEAWYLPDSEQWIWGVQWHPEMLSDSLRGRRIFDAFLAACRQRNF